MKRGVLTPELKHLQRIRWHACPPNRGCSALSKRGLQEFLATGKVDELVLTAPVMAFEQYLRWLALAIRSFAVTCQRDLRVIDEPTAAAFGCRSTRRTCIGDHFGGGTRICLWFSFQAIMTTLPGALPYHLALCPRSLLRKHGRKSLPVLSLKHPSASAEMTSTTFRRLASGVI